MKYYKGAIVLKFFGRGPESRHVPVLINTERFGGAIMSSG
jgi:hypothetical protein